MSFMKRDAVAAKAFLAVILAVFCLNSVSHDYLCHEELHGVCGPLHWTAPNPAPDPAPGMPLAPREFGGPALPGDADVIPGFISDIFHPPD